MSNERKSVLIIGAGISGLSTGIYARLNGYDTRIFEMHDKPGGYCTSWTRKGYTFDYSIHNLSGTLPDSELHNVWLELGAFRGSDVVDHKELVRVEDEKGNTFIVHSELKKTVAEMRRLSPQNGPLFKDYEKAAHRLRSLDLFAAALGGWKRTLRMLPYLGILKKWGATTMGDFAKQIQGPFLRQAFPLTQYGIPDLPMIVHLIFVSGLDRGDLGWPQGGSLAFAKRMEQRHLVLGGKIDYHAKVERIIVEGGRAVGVRLADGSEHRADIIVAACDGHALQYSLLEGKYVTREMEEYFQSAPSRQSFGLQLSLGVKRDLSQEPHAIALLLDEPIRLEDEDIPFLNIEVFGPVTRMAPEGKGVIKVILDSNYDFWSQMARDPELYQQKKDEVAEVVLGKLERRFPGLREQIEVVDVSTLLTAERFTGNYHGLQPWDTKRAALDLMRNGLNRTIPGVEGLYCVGQWAEGMVGINTAALSGRRLVQTLCKQAGKKFVTSPKR
ncbi:MAG: NAD(P)/FAD-dependent oxidoreductase [Methanomassiliicoccales archaeon]